jgi:hypothetical protein
MFLSKYTFFRRPFPGEGEEVGLGPGFFRSLSVMDDGGTEVMPREGGGVIYFAEPASSVEKMAHARSNQAMSGSDMVWGVRECLPPLPFLVAFSNCTTISPWMWVCRMKVKP